MIVGMAEARSFGQGSRNALVLVVLLIIAAGFILPHWHTEWNGPGCELCHIRYLSTLHSAVADSPAVPVATERDWHSENSSNELDASVLTRSSRAPPASTPFAA